LVIIFFRSIVQPEKRRELSQTLLSRIEHVRKGQGCLQANVHQDAENEDRFLVIEAWDTQKDADEYLKSDIFKVLLGAACLMQRPPEIDICTVSRSTRLEV